MIRMEAKGLTLSNQLNREIKSPRNTSERKKIWNLFISRVLRRGLWGRELSAGEKLSFILHGVCMPPGQSEGCPWLLGSNYCTLFYCFSEDVFVKGRGHSKFHAIVC